MYMELEVVGWRFGVGGWVDVGGCWGASVHTTCACMWLLQLLLFGELMPALVLCGLVALGLLSPLGCGCCLVTIVRSR